MWERGYAATSPGAILRKAEVGQGSMYHHYAGKQDLAAAALANTADDLAARAEGALSTGESAVERLTGYLLLERNVLRGCPVGRMAGDPEVLTIPALHVVLERTFDDIRDRVVSVVAEGVRRGEIAAELDAVELADMILAVVQGGYVLARAAGDVAPFNRAVGGAVALLHQARRDG